VPSSPLKCSATRKAAGGGTRRWTECTYSPTPCPQLPKYCMFRNMKEGILKVGFILFGAP